MLMAFVGRMDDELTDLCIRGNGKTCSMVFYGYLYHKKGYKIWSNFKTSFSDKIIGFQEMINTLREMKKRNEEIRVVLLVTEMQDLINSLGSTTEQTLFVDSFANQLRKLDVDCLFDTQIFKNINVRLRRHTENIRIPIKYHLNGQQCNFDRCQKKHYILIYSQQPYKINPLRKIRAYEVGKLYDSKEMIIDKLEIIKEEKPKEEKIKKISEEEIITFSFLGGNLSGD